jgi:hypothetical protein
VFDVVENRRKIAHNEGVMNDERVLKIAVNIILVIIASWIVLNFLLPLPNSIAQELFWIREAQDVEDHRQLWFNQRITKYEIGVRFKMAFLSFPGSTTFQCAQKLIVDENRITQIILNTCGEDSFLTVDKLFSMIEEKVKSRLCDPEGCKCGPMVVDVVYDPQYFFPKEAKTFYD